MNLQTRYDLEIQKVAQNRLEKEVAVLKRAV